MSAYQVRAIRDQIIICLGLGTPMKALLRCHMLPNANMITLIEGLATSRDFMVFTVIKNGNFRLLLFSLCMIGNGGDTTILKIILFVSTKYKLIFSECKLLYTGGNFVLIFMNPTFGVKKGCTLHDLNVTLFWSTNQSSTLNNGCTSQPFMPN